VRQAIGDDGLAAYTMSYTIYGMAQITIYLPDSIEKKARQAAKAEGTSVSRWVASEVVRRLEEALPRAVIEAAGTAPDFPELAEIRKSYGKDSRRETMH
jgi:hypothetical protein